jgi:acetyltransferase
MLTIRPVEPGDEEVLAPLCDILADSIAGGASIGFLEPLLPETAERYWRAVLASLGDDLRLWVAELDWEIVGTVQLARCEKANGRHRAEVRKLLVRRAERGQGIARRLMDTVEDCAREMGLLLLHLDTHTGSDAEFLYLRLGWTKVGVIPEYAGTPDGVLQDCSFLYKQLSPADGPPADRAAVAELPDTP